MLCWYVLCMYNVGWYIGLQYILHYHVHRRTAVWIYAEAMLWTSYICWTLGLNKSTYKQMLGRQPKQPEILLKFWFSENGTKNLRNFPLTYSVQSFPLLAQPLQQPQMSKKHHSTQIVLNLPKLALQLGRTLSMILMILMAHIWHCDSHIQVLRSP